MAFYTDIEPVFSQDHLRNYKIDTDEEAIKHSLRNIFLIHKGTVPGKPWFGNPLDATVFDLFSFFSQRDMEASIRNAIALWEPRVRVESVDITLAPEYNRIIIIINYTYVIDYIIKYNSLEMPLSYNNISFLGGRLRPPELAPPATECALVPTI